MKIAIAQLQLSENVAQNIQKTMDVMEEAAKKGAQLICFPEVQFYPFFPQYPKRDASAYEIEIGDEVVKMMQEKCKALKLVAIPNFYLKENGLTYDASPLIDMNGEILGISKMVHILQAPCFYEQDYYTPSDSGFKVYDTTVGKVGVVICYDRHFPESIRSCALQGADIIIIPTAIMEGEPLELFEWEVRIPAVQNSVFIAMCNRVGVEGKMNFCGGSILIDPNGAVIQKADAREQIIYADIDLKQATIIRDKINYFNLRRPEAYVN